MSAELAKKYINDHNNPVTKKIESFGSKLFLTSTDENENKKQKCLQKIENSLKYNRVDRRVARSISEWLPERNLAKVTKITGTTSGFGFQDKNGKFLNPEETLFLMETNKLELFYKNSPMSIEEAFKNIKDFNKYLIFKQLSLLGYKFKAKSKSLRETDCDASTSVEIKEPPAKILKLDKSRTTTDDFFAKLRENGPKTFQGNVPSNQAPNFYITNPNRTEQEFIPLILCNEVTYTPKVDENYKNIYAISNSDNVAFYKFYNVNIPIL